MTEKMLVTTTEVPTGYEVDHAIGEVFGMTVQSKNVISNIGASIKNVFGGEIKSYTNMLETARQEAIDRMCENASKMGGNAVIMMRFDSGSIGTDMMSITAYGTAVVLKK